MGEMIDGVPIAEPVAEPKETFRGGLPHEQGYLDFHTLTQRLEAAEKRIGELETVWSKDSSEKRHLDTVMSGMDQLLNTLRFKVENLEHADGATDQAISLLNDKLKAYEKHSNTELIGKLIVSEKVLQEKVQELVNKVMGCEDAVASFATRISIVPHVVLEALVDKFSKPGYDTIEEVAGKLSRTKKDELRRLVRRISMQPILAGVTLRGSPEEQ